MENGISEQGSVATINNITLFNRQPTKRSCFLGCGNIFETTEGGPRICPKCRKKLNNLKISSRNPRPYFPPNRYKRISAI